MTYVGDIKHEHRLIGCVGREHTHRRGVPVELGHPLGSAYNFYTWAEQLCDFVTEVVQVKKATLPTTETIFEPIRAAFLGQTIRPATEGSPSHKGPI